MDGGTFLGCYDKKIQEWYDKINQTSDLSEKNKLKNAMHDYMADCLPYLCQYMNDDDDTTEIIGPFNTKIKKGIQRREIFNEYLKNVEGYKGVLPDSSAPKIRMNDINKCPACNNCNIYLDSRTSYNVCKDCGLCEYVIGEELSYKEEQETSEKIVINSYKRDNHLNEWILQFQGREMTNIPDTVIEQLRTEFRKQRIKHVSEITQPKVKALLRKLRLSKYYEHATYITNILNGLEPPVMSRELEHRLRLMFKEVQVPFEKHCPANRSNFLSYSYVLYKFCELLAEDDYLPYFPLLKSKEKLRQQDVIWSGICRELKWEYIPTC
jgi:hypothetical protein